MARIEPHERFWIVLESIAKKGPHIPEMMRSTQSLGPVRTFCCDLCRRTAVLYHPLDATPICKGSTRAIFQGSDD